MRGRLGQGETYCALMRGAGDKFVAHGHVHRGVIIRQTPDTRSITNIIASGILDAIVRNFATGRVESRLGRRQYSGAIAKMN